ncbi:type II site-specific deoxyribonuclease [Streptomyces sp. GBA 94-10 4N24]|uniref:XamI family restriction endonuclease n=1 Tax=Streptomyces TaxID=1883 RepID=UPI0003C2C577|nr:XamI family restriction endonuclease [Streptomyces sp. GBA 94-10 4N24]ESP99314.1 type II site-specific deoxyribonuclease [Streptomyces sp. GBA 94-10 4N24]UZN59822.1 type II site-specific deoxyribonuclease [Streptomyces sp. GBA 94-10 4N24]
MINADKPHHWKRDVQASVRLYNQWFLDAAPKAYRDTRQLTIDEVEQAFQWTADMTSITPAVLKAHPKVLATLRMSTAPPIARDRLVGLSYGSKSLLDSMEKGKLPPRMTADVLDLHLEKMCAVLTELLDLDLFHWYHSGEPVGHRQRELAATVVADRLCGAIADPIVRNAQERRQLALIEEWLLARGYIKKPHSATLPLNTMQPGTFSFRQNVVVGDGLQVNIPVDAVIQPHTPKSHGFPILIEAKSAGDFTNTNKRRKEEATKIHQLQAKYGSEISLTLFLCGYFNTGYLGYSAAEGLDWVWEHRIDDLEAAGV